MSTRYLNRTRAGSALCLTLLLVLAAALVCEAAAPTGVSVNNLSSKKLTLTVGKSTIVESADVIRRVSVAAPEVADTVALSARQVYVTGKASGVTTITLWGDANRISAVYDVEVLPDVVALKEKIHQIFPAEKDVKVLATHDSITLSGTVSSAANLTQLVRLAEAYAPADKTGGKPKVLSLVEVGGVHQVMLEVRVAEMSQSLMRRLGINFAYISESGAKLGHFPAEQPHEAPDRRVARQPPDGWGQHQLGIPFFRRRCNMDGLHRCAEGRRPDEGPRRADAHYPQRTSRQLPGRRRVPDPRTASLRRRNDDHH